MKLVRLVALWLVLNLFLLSPSQSANIETYISTGPDVSFPLGSSDYIPIVQGNGPLKRLPGDLLTTGGPVPTANILGGSGGILTSISVGTGLQLSSGILSSTGMNTSASNGLLPGATRNLGLAYTVKPGSSIQTALTNASVLGGTVFVQAGALYNITTPLVISSNTHLQCEQGVTINAMGASWTGTVATWSGQVPAAAIINANQDAGSISDENITVEGCAFTTDATWAVSGGYHAIEIRRARNIKVLRNRFTAGGNGTAMVANNGTVVDGNYMIGALNACWDHWDDPSNGVVTDSNYCESSGYGVLVTGTDTFQTSAGQATNFRIAGIYKITGTLIAGIWVNGIGAAGSGATNVVIDKPVITYANAAGTQQGCIKVSGATTRVKVSDPICTNSYMSVNSDSGGTPSDVTFTSPIMNGFTAGGGAGYPIQIYAGDHVAIHNARIRKGAGTYAYAIGIEPGVTNTRITNLDAETGASGILTDAGTNTINPVVTTVSTAWTPEIRFGGNATSMVYVEQTGRYWQAGSMVCINFKLQLSAKGSSTGAATIIGLPVAHSAAIGGDLSAINISYLANTTGITVRPYADVSNSQIILYVDGGNRGANLTEANFANSALIYGNGCYPTGS